MRAYTIAGGVLHDGIELIDGAVDCGTIDNRPARAIVDPSAERRGDRLLSAPGRGALVLLTDHAHVSWRIRAAQPAEWWDRMVATESIPNALDRILVQERVRSEMPHGAPVGWHELARGYGAAEGGGRGPLTVYAYVEDGASFEIRRRGRLDCTPSVFRVTCSGETVTVADPRAETLARLAAKGTGR